MTKSFSCFQNGPEFHKRTSVLGGVEASVAAESEGHPARASGAAWALMYPLVVGCLPAAGKVAA